MNELIETDVLIIGCGIGGGTAALKLAQAGVKVTLITRSHEPANTNTAWAQGGIIYRGHDDSPQLLAEDIDRAGAYFTNPSAVRVANMLLNGGGQGSGVNGDPTKATAELGKRMIDSKVNAAVDQFNTLKGAP